MPLSSDDIVARLEPAGDRDPLVGLRRLGHALRRVPAAGPAARRVRADRRRRRGPPAHRDRAAPWRCTSRGTRSTTSTGCARTSRRAGCASAPSTRTCSRTRTTSSARSRTPTPPCASARSRTCSSASRSPRRWASTAQSLWLADGTNYAGQDDLRARRRRMLDALGAVYAALPADQELLVEYKFFEPAFYATDLADWGSAVLLVPAARRAREGARRPRPPRPGRRTSSRSSRCWPTRAGSAASTSTTASTPTTT